MVHISDQLPGCRSTDKMAGLMLSTDERRSSLGTSYIRYIPTIPCYTDGILKIWWFPRDFSQSRLGDRTMGSNACTLIALMIAKRISTMELIIYGDVYAPLNKRLINALAESIVDGNELHETMYSEGLLVDVNLTIPEALVACNYYLPPMNEWRSEIFTGTIRETMAGNIKQGLDAWDLLEFPTESKFDLFIVVIADCRSVLLVVQRQVANVTFIDSHSHGKNGMVTVQVPIVDLDPLAVWYEEMCEAHFRKRPDCYELSFLYVPCEEITSMIEAVVLSTSVRRSGEDTPSLPRPATARLSTTTVLPTSQTTSRSTSVARSTSAHQGCCSEVS